MFELKRIDLVQLIEMASRDLRITRKAIYDEAGISDTNHAKWKTFGADPKLSSVNKIIDAIQQLYKRQMRARRK